MTASTGQSTSSSATRRTAQAQPVAGVRDSGFPSAPLPSSFSYMVNEVTITHFTLIFVSDPMPPWYGCSWAHNRLFTTPPSLAGLRSCVVKCRARTTTTAMTRPPRTLPRTPSPWLPPTGPCAPCADAGRPTGAAVARGLRTARARTRSTTGGKWATRRNANPSPGLVWTMVLILYSKIWGCVVIHQCTHI